MLDFLKQIINPVAKVVDEVHTSDEERLKLKTALYTVEVQLATKALDYEKSILQAKQSIIVAEAQGQSWMQRNWRPITMLTFLVLVVADTFGLTHFRLSEEAWTLLQIGLGGYVVGRSAEKVVPKLTEALKTKVK